MGKHNKLGANRGLGRRHGHCNVHLDAVCWRRFVDAYHGPPMGAVHCATSGLVGVCAMAGGLQAGHGKGCGKGGGGLVLRLQGVSYTGYVHHARCVVSSCSSDPSRKWRQLPGTPSYRSSSARQAHLPSCVQLTLPGRLQTDTCWTRG